MRPPWIPCPHCDEFLCTIHGGHVSECACPPIEEWTTDPYANPAAVALGKLGGAAKTEKKRAASAANGRKGGRPKKESAPATLARGVRALPAAGG